MMSTLLFHGWKRLIRQKAESRTKEASPPCRRPVGGALHHLPAFLLWAPPYCLCRAAFLHVGCLNCCLSICMIENRAASFCIGRALTLLQCLSSFLLNKHLITAPESLFRGTFLDRCKHHSCLLVVVGEFWSHFSFHGSDMGHFS